MTSVANYFKKVNIKVKLTQVKISGILFYITYLTY